MAALAKANQGRTACGRNSLGGVGHYTSRTGGPENWCADFAKWVWANSGYNVNGLTHAAISFTAPRRVFHSTPQAGEVIVYGASGGSAQHVGIVTAVTSIVIHTENGNFGGGGNPAKSVVTPRTCLRTLRSAPEPRSA
ncbi:CHAP domain-containing protein [Dactylosporangium matsuzakiense]|uniref:CHAP domain-containing protein n=1 Tax=Dactylosporangium matsuzakiense TaxID=53360 RepID=UPI0034D9861B